MSEPSMRANEPAVVGVGGTAAPPTPFVAALCASRSRSRRLRSVAAFASPDTPLSAASNWRDARPTTGRERRPPPPPAGAAAEAGAEAADVDELGCADGAGRMDGVSVRAASFAAAAAALFCAPRGGRDGFAGLAGWAPGAPVFGAFLVFAAADPCGAFFVFCAAVAAAAAAAAAAFFPFFALGWTELAAAALPFASALGGGAATAFFFSSLRSAATLVLL